MILNCLRVYHKILSNKQHRSEDELKMFNNLTPILKDIDNQILLNSNKNKTKDNKNITFETVESLQVISTANVEIEAFWYDPN